MLSLSCSDILYSTAETLSKISSLTNMCQQLLISGKACRGDALTTLMCSLGSHVYVRMSEDQDAAKLVLAQKVCAYIVDLNE